MSLKKIMFRFEKNKEFKSNIDKILYKNKYSKNRIEIMNEIQNKFSKLNYKNAKIEIYILTPKKDFFSTSMKNQIKISIYISDIHRQDNNINFSFNYNYEKDIFKSYILNGKYKSNIYQFQDGIFSNIIKYTLSKVFKKSFLNEKLNNKTKIKKGELGKLSNNNIRLNNQDYYLNIYTFDKNSYEEIKEKLLLLTNKILVGIEFEIKTNRLFLNNSKSIKKYPISYNIPFVDTYVIMNKPVVNKRLKKWQTETEYKILNLRKIF